MKRLYAGFSFGCKTGGMYSIVPVSVIAESKNEAIGIAMTCAKERFKTEDGYFNHSADVIAVTDEQIESVALVTCE